MLDMPNVNLLSMYILNRLISKNKIEVFQQRNLANLTILWYIASDQYKNCLLRYD